MNSLREINLHCTIVEKGVELDLRALQFIRRLLLGFAIIRGKNKVVILGKNKYHYIKDEGNIKTSN